MQIEHIVEFLKLAECLNYNTTAKRLFITTSALSRHISNIEEELGHKLLERDAHGVALTAEGRAFQKGATILVQDYEFILSSLANVSRDECFDIKIGYLLDAARDHLPVIDRILKKPVSGVKASYFAFEGGRIQTALENRIIQIGIDFISFEIPSDAYEAVVLSSDRHFVAVPKGHPLAHQASIDLAEIASENIILPSSDSMPSMRQFYESIFRKEEIEVKSRLIFGDIPSLGYMIANGMGISLILGHHREHMRDNLVFVPIRNDIPECYLAIVWEKSLEERIPGTWANDLRRLGLPFGR